MRLRAGLCVPALVHPSLLDPTCALRQSLRSSLTVLKREALSARDALGARRPRSPQQARPRATHAKLRKDFERVSATLGPIVAKVEMATERMLNATQQRSAQGAPLPGSSAWKPARSGSATRSGMTLAPMCRRTPGATSVSSLVAHGSESGSAGSGHQL